MDLSRKMGQTAIYNDSLLFGQDGYYCNLPISGTKRGGFL